MGERNDNLKRGDYLTIYYLSPRFKRIRAARNRIIDFYTNSQIRRIQNQQSIGKLRVEFVVGSLPCSERFFSGYSGFPLSSKTNTPKFQFDLERTETFKRVHMNS